MNSKITFTSLVMAALLVACSGADDATPKLNDVKQVSIGEGIPAPAVALIERKYSATPELHAATTSFANAFDSLLLKARTGAPIDAQLVEKTANAQSCFQEKALRINGSFVSDDYAELRDAMLGTEERNVAFQAVSSSVDVVSIKVHTTEAEACAAAGVPS